MSSVLGPGRVRTEVVGPEGQSINYNESGGGLNQVVEARDGLERLSIEVDGNTPSVVNLPDATHFNSVAIRVKGPSGYEVGGFFVEGRNAGWAAADYRPLVVVGSSYQILPGWISMAGDYTIDLRGVDQVRVRRLDAVTGATIECVLSTALPPTPASGPEFGLSRFERIVPGQDYDGKFYAIKALTDCALHERIRFIPRFFGDPESTAGLTREDILAGGDIIYGPFSKVRIDTGVALAYHLL